MKRRESWRDSTPSGQRQAGCWTMERAGNFPRIFCTMSRNSRSPCGGSRRRGATPDRNPFWDTRSTRMFEESTYFPSNRPKTTSQPSPAFHSDVFSVKICPLTSGDGQQTCCSPGSGHPKTFLRIRSVVPNGGVVRVDPTYHGSEMSMTE